MSNKVEKELCKAALLTFEDLGFMFPEPELEEENPLVEPEASVSVEFWGPFNGRLVVTVCGGLLPALAANMLGEEAPPSELQQYDALGEISNVICGNVLPAIAGSKAVFHIGAPQRLQNPETPDRGSPEAKVHLALDQGRADLFLFIDKAVSCLEEQPQ